MQQTIQKQKKNSGWKMFKDILVMTKRNLLKVRHNLDKLMDVTLMPVFFMVMFAYVFGGAVSGDVKNYLPIVVPGVLVQTLLTASSGAGTQLREDLETGVFDRFKSLPIARVVPLAGLLLADILRYIIASAFGVATGYVLGWRPEAGLLWVIIASLFGIFISWALSWVFATIGLLVSSAATIQGVSMILMMMLTFLSNAFVPIKTLPTALYHFAKWNPITLVINAYREMMTNGQIGADAYYVIATGIAIVLIFVPITLKLYNKKT